MGVRQGLVCAVAAASLVGIAEGQINLKSSNLTIRESTTANNTTVNYGDLTLDGGTTGTSWGWLWCNRIFNWGESNLGGPVNIVGGLYVSGGTKNFVQDHPTDTAKVIVYVAAEAGEALTIARGTATTLDGSVRVDLPDHFTLVTDSAAPLTVLLTPRDVPVSLCATERSHRGFTAVARAADISEFGDVDFDYRVTGIRDGYADHVAIRDAENCTDPVKDPQGRLARQDKKQKALATSRKPKETR